MFAFLKGKSLYILIAFCLVLIALLRISSLRRELIEEKYEAVMHENNQLTASLQASKIEIDDLLYYQEKLDNILLEHEKSTTALQEKSKQTQDSLRSASKKNDTKEWYNDEIPKSIYDVLTQ